MIRSTLIAAALILAPLAAQAAQAEAPEAAAAPAGPATVTFGFPDIKTHAGVLRVALFDSAEGWAAGKAVRVATAQASDAEPLATIEGLAVGTYAARVFQDVDGDGKMGRNAFGMPTEPFGFSAGAVPIMGAPSFEAASFKLEAGTSRQAITLY